MTRQLAKIAAVLVVLMLVTGAAARAQAPTFTVLHSFTGSPDGAYPSAVTTDAAGNLYGTTFSGGASTNCSGGCGTVFKLDISANEIVLHSFTGADGEAPVGAPVMDAAGNLYGVTETGGGVSCYDPLGCGTVFKLDISGNETVLHSFTAGSDGGNPEGGLIIGKTANLYGNAINGGSFGFGTVFKLDTSGSETVLHNFKGYPSDGTSPIGTLIMDAAGNLYGVTFYGGAGTCSNPVASGCGIVFKVDTSGNETVLHSFTNSGGDGARPVADLVVDALGNLYGTTTSGGAPGFGIVFKLDSSGNETVLYTFTGLGGDGEGPSGLVMDKAGNLYGTTGSGGAHGLGTVFKFDSSGNETILHNFTGYPNDGANPNSLGIDTAGNLYGTTSVGGASGLGTVFKLIVQTPPIIASISPTSSVAGGPTFILTVNGTNFVSGSTVNFNGNARTTTFVNATQLTVTILGSDIAAAGSFNVTVTNPGDGTSNPLSFTVVTPQDATGGIVNPVNALFSQGVINGGQDNSLVRHLQHAIELINAGKNNGAIGNLDAFIGEVNDLLNSGVLSSSQAASLVSAAQSVIAALP